MQRVAALTFNGRFESVYGRCLTRTTCQRNRARDGSPTCTPTRLPSCSVSEYIALLAILQKMMRLSLKRLSHWMRKRTTYYPRSDLNGLESLGDSSGFGGDLSPVQYDNLNSCGDSFSVCISAGRLSLGEIASGSSSYLCVSLSQRHRLILGDRLGPMTTVSWI